MQSHLVTLLYSKIVRSIKQTKQNKAVKSTWKDFNFPQSYFRFSAKSFSVSTCELLTIYAVASSTFYLYIFSSIYHFVYLVFLAPANGQTYLGMVYFKYVF